VLLMASIGFAQLQYKSFSMIGGMGLISVPNSCSIRYLHITHKMRHAEAPDDIHNTCSTLHAGKWNTVSLMLLNPPTNDDADAHMHE